MGLYRNRLWAIGSGNGGVGKSFLTAALGAELAHSGMSVVVVDANLASPGLHFALGIAAPGARLLDAVDGRISCADALLPTPIPGMRYASCAGDAPGMADIPGEDRDRLLQCVASLEADAVLLDCGCGAAFGVLDFFNLAGTAIVVATPEQASLQSAFGFMRHAILRNLQKKFAGRAEISTALRRMRPAPGSGDPFTMTEFLNLLGTSCPEAAAGAAAVVGAFRPFLLLNMAASGQDQRMSEVIQAAAARLLNLEVRAGGWIPYSAGAGRPISPPCAGNAREPEPAAAEQIRAIAARLTYAAAPETAAGSRDPSPQPVGRTPGLNANLMVMGRELHVQTEDLGWDARCIVTQVFWQGRVLFSTRSGYPESAESHRPAASVFERMRHQHYHVIREIETRGASFQEPVAAHP